MRTLLITLVLAVAWIAPAFAQSADEIIRKAHLNSYYAGKDGSTQMLMKVYRPGAAKPITKLFYMLKRDEEDGGAQQFFIYFTRPSDIRRTTFLVHKFIDRDDLRRLYIPASDKVLAISGSRKQDPFMGSDFSYEDVSGRHYTRDAHRLLGRETLNDREVFVTESTPKVKESKTSRMKAWIDTSTYIPLKVDFYNHEGKVYKTYASDEVVTIQGYPTILKRTMVSPLEGSRTEILVNPKKTRYDLGLEASLFSERSLKNPPAQYLK